MSDLLKALNNLPKIKPYAFRVLQAGNGEYYWSCHATANGRKIAWSGETHKTKEYAEYALQRFIKNIKDHH